MALSPIEQTALAALDERGLLAAIRDLLRIPSITGQEAQGQRWLARHMQQLGLDVNLWEIDVAQTLRHPQFPGMEVDRGGHEALGLVGAWQAGDGPKLIFNGHVDVVPAGDRANWRHDPWGA